MAKPNLENYIEVNDRIKLFYDKYPKGSLQQLHPPQVVEVDGSHYLIYTAAAYRDPNDVRPGVGTAWEPVPGKTSFTRDSEMMNAETSAWGRAIAALGIGLTNSVATKQEVLNRTEGTPSGTSYVQIVGEKILTYVKAGSEEEEEARKALVKEEIFRNFVDSTPREGSLNTLLGRLTPDGLTKVDEWVGKAT